MLLSTILEDHLLSPEITSPETGRRYRTTLNTYEQWLGHTATFDDLSPDNWRRWIDERQKAAIVSEGTIRGDAEKLLVLWRHGAEMLVQPMPRIKLPPKAESLPSAWTDDEMARLFEAARQSRRRIGGVPSAIYWPALLGVMYDTGERVAAVTSLERGDIDLANRRVHFRRRTRKGRRSDNRSEIHAITAEDLGRLLQVSGDVFAVVKYQSLYSPYRHLVTEAGLPYSRTGSFHKVRRTTATNCVRQGIDPAAKLGHHDPSVTRRHYIDTTNLGTMLPARPKSTPRKGSWFWPFGKGGAA